jgi:hypothetical protein
MGKIDIKVKMVSAVTEVLKFKKENPRANYEQSLQHISNIVKKEKNQYIKLGMVSSASKALSILEREPRLKDKDVMRKIVDELPKILEKIDK